MVPSFAVKMLVRALRTGEDEIVQHYAAKTIQNVCRGCARLCLRLLGVVGVFSVSRAVSMVHGHA